MQGQDSQPVNVHRRRKARRALVQALYQWHMNAAKATAIVAEFVDNGALKDADRPFFDQVLMRTVTETDALDALYEGVLDRAKEQLDGVERAILRLGACELRSRPDVPWRVVIDEYVELAKLFGAQDSYKYVNGVLDKLAGQLRPEELDG